MKLQALAAIQENWGLINTGYKCIINMSDFMNENGKYVYISV
jgi:hypothetical protein